MLNQATRSAMEVVVVESAQATYARHRSIFDLVVQGIEEVASAHHARPGAAHRRMRHANVLAGDIRADLLDWLEARLPSGWTLPHIANSGIELTGPGGVAICVRRPDSEGHAPGAESERRERMYREPPLFVLDEDEPGGLAVPEQAVIATIIATWGYDHVASDVWLKLSAPSGVDSWYWSDKDIDLAVVDDTLPASAEEDDDPLDAEDEMGEEADEA